MLAVRGDHRKNRQQKVQATYDLLEELFAPEEAEAPESDCSGPRPESRLLWLVLSVCLSTVLLVFCTQFEPSCEGYE